MKKIRPAVWFSLLLLIGAAGAAVAISEENAPARLLDSQAWIALSKSDPEKLILLLASAFVSAIGAVGSAIAIFAPRPLSKNQLDAALELNNDKLVAQIQAALQSGLHSPPSGDIGAAQKAAITDIIASTDPRYAAIRENLEKENFDAAVDDLLALARADQARSSARNARRARDAGALAFGRDIVKSIAAYEMAAQLDPDDFWTHIFLARLYLDSGKTSAAETSAALALQLARHDRDRAIAYDKLGDVLVRQGKFDAASKYYFDSLDVRRVLAHDHPTVQTQRDLTVALDRVGNLLYRRGDLSGALQHYLEALHIARETLAIIPDDNELQSDLAVSYEKLGDIKSRAGDFSAALDAHRESLALRRKLSASHPSDPKRLADTSISLEKIGDALSEAEKHSEAKEAYEESFAINQKLTVEDPSNVKKRRGVAVSLEKLGDVSFRLGNIENSYRHYSGSLAIRRALANCDANDTQALRDLHVTLNKIGMVLRERGDLADAVRSQEEGLAISRKLHADNQGNAEVQFDLGVDHFQLGVTLGAVPDKEHACRHLRQARALFVQVAAGAPAWAKARKSIEVTDSYIRRVCGG